MWKNPNEILLVNFVYDLLALSFSNKFYKKIVFIILYILEFFFKKTIATLTTFGQNVFQRGCLSQCTDTGRIVNGQILGVFCCNTTLCNTVVPTSNLFRINFL